MLVTDDNKYPRMFAGAGASGGDNVALYVQLSAKECKWLCPCGTPHSVAMPAPQRQLRVTLKQLKQKATWGGLTRATLWAYCPPELREEFRAWLKQKYGVPT